MSIGAISFARPMRAQRVPMAKPWFVAAVIAHLDVPAQFVLEPVRLDHRRLVVDKKSRHGRPSCGTRPARGAGPLGAQPRIRLIVRVAVVVSAPVPARNHH